MIKKVFFVFFYLMVFQVYAQDITYKPINVFFGGDAFKYQQALLAANAQNDFQQQNQSELEQPSEIDNFTENLNRQLLNALSQSLFQQQIGSASNLTVGTYKFGSLVVEVTPAVGGLSVSILNTNTGEQTQIIIPSN